MSLQALSTSKMRLCYATLVLVTLLTSSFCQVTVTVTAPSTTNPGSATHTIAVGRGGNTFIPDVVQADVGDTIEFDFYPLNHSVVRAEYMYPCIPYEKMTSKDGFFSGFKPVDDVALNPPSWSVAVNDTNPIFFYCSAPDSCLKSLMMGVINPNASESLQVQRDSVTNSSIMLQPGQAWPAEGSSTILPTTTVTSAPTSASTPYSQPAATTSAAATASSHKSSLSTGAIAGIAIGGAAVLIAAGVLIWWCGRQSRRKQIQPDAPPTYAPPQISGYPPMSPTAKHMSGVSTNPAYPTYQYHEQPNMGPFGAVGMSPQPTQQMFYHPQPSAGHASASPLMGPLGGHGVVEADSMRGGSPSPPPQTQTGIAAFLERSGRMSPSTEGQTESTNRK